ncbi:MAG: MerR family transcriptional regulator [Lachnospiraceae bacterium]|nr:MerR family transcriptional regulator [Lachnospiraceae bacterium]
MEHKPKLKTVHEVSKLTGVSVRTLHHYDAIGLLKPSEITGAGYRLYDDTALLRLQNILLFRELKFPLKEIGRILDSSDFDQNEALSQQIALLTLEYERLSHLIRFAKKIQEKEVVTMEFHVFDRSEIEKYKEEASRRWGDTKEYKEFLEREGEGLDAAKSSRELLALFTEIGAQKNLLPADTAVQEKIRKLQQFITTNYYTCSKEILSGLGQMYIQDERFRQTIDQAGGEGTATFVGKAISIYCNMKDA